MTEFYRSVAQEAPLPPPSVDEMVQRAEQEIDKGGYVPYYPPLPPELRGKIWETLYLYGFRQFPKRKLNMEEQLAQSFTLLTVEKLEDLKKQTVQERSRECLLLGYVNDEELRCVVGEEPATISKVLKMLRTFFIPYLAGFPLGDMSKSDHVSRSAQLEEIQYDLTSNPAKVRKLEKEKRECSEPKRIHELRKQIVLFETPESVKFQGLYDAYQQFRRNNMTVVLSGILYLRDRYIQDEASKERLTQLWQDLDYVIYGKRDGEKVGPCYDEIDDINLKLTEVVWRVEDAIVETMNRVYGIPIRFLKQGEEGNT